MTNFNFGKLLFTISDSNKITMSNCYDLSHAPIALCEFDVAGGNTVGTNYASGSLATEKLDYVSHKIADNVLTVVQKSNIAEVTSVYTMYDDTNAIRVTHTVKNIAEDTMCLEMANSFGMLFGAYSATSTKDWYIHEFHNARYTEGMPIVRSLYDCGIQWTNKIYHIENIGNKSSLEYLPQGVIENRATGDFMMFQIESYYDWFYEIRVKNGSYMLQTGGPIAFRHAWNKHLATGESYTTVPVAIAYGKSLNEMVAEMTKYRRHIKPNCPADETLPTIFNEYMHFSWDDPFAHRVYETAPAVAATGVKYYVIDCGWHDGIGVDMYPHFGTWYEDRGRFPDGIRAVADYVRSLGMKFGLWIAPEVVGVDNKKMLEYYDDTCFMLRNGKKIGNSTGYLLDYRNPKVWDYMEKALDRMIDEYGCDYIKYDGCSNPAFGTDYDCTSPGDGLEKSIEAFLNFTKHMMKKHPDVIFEDCAGGGQRIDYSALSIFQLVSTSDQTDYTLYPYIVVNILASVLPEQAAVWSYPVDSKIYNPDTVNEKVTDERVAMNMINSLLGRLHLSSRVQKLSDGKLALIKEGIDLYDKLTPEKLNAVPYLPLGYCKYMDTSVAAGLKTDGKLYLAVWNLNGERDVKIDLPEIEATAAKVIYPTTLPTTFEFADNVLTIHFTEDYQARFFEIDLK